MSKYFAISHVLIPKKTFPLVIHCINGSIGGLITIIRNFRNNEVRIASRGHDNVVSNI